MRAIASLIASAALCLGAVHAQAQPAANSTAPAPAGGGMMGRGMGGGPGMGGHMGGGMRAGPGYTVGWSMMTPQERREHRAKMMSFTSAKACRAYLEQHHRLMVERARRR